MGIKERCAALGLEAPAAFWLTDEATLAMMTGGCGPGKYGDYLVPDTAWLLSIRPACVIHDFEYAVGQTPEEKKAADHRFLDNMLLIIDQKSKFWPLKVVRRWRAMSYYSFVADGGDSSFKNATLN
ncbi:hypothetical protein KAR91_12205 [Candidatus Pacearchaeota archaeon]|nr:hypothetical protein [Candidatus Pacearchaeota archaeon]